jgi:hypothetical protein
MIDSLVFFFCSSTHAPVILSAAYMYIYAWLCSSSYCHDHLKTKRNPIGTHWHAGFFFSSSLSTWSHQQIKKNKRTNQNAYNYLLKFFKYKKFVISFLLKRRKKTESIIDIDIYTIFFFSYICWCSYSMCVYNSIRVRFTKFKLRNVNKMCEP